MQIKHELQNIISGDGQVRHGEIIQSITRYLRGEKKANSGTEKAKLLKEQEKEILLNFIEEHHLHFDLPHESTFLGSGAEQKVYEHSDPRFVIKLNDTIFYEFWEDYFISLVLHNYFFPHLAYELIGFSLQNNDLLAVVKQPFVRSDVFTDLANVRDFLEANGFVNTKNNDYVHPDLGIILEDLHDENVLTEGGTLQFIDTVFYLTPKFFER